MKIKFVDLHRQLYGDSYIKTKGIIEEIKASLESCINSTSFIMGSELEKFENMFADYCKARYCIGLNSGTDALEFALRCNGITTGNVITVPNSYFTTASSISQAGAKPKFVDIDKKTYNIDVNKIEDAIDNNTRAIIPVHLYGRPSQMGKIIEIAERNNIKIIEDCAQAHGSEFNGKIVPIYGTGAFSFFPGKNLGCFGDGGALITNDPNVEKKARMWRNDGSISKYHHEILGRKARLDTIQASILSVKLKYLNQWNQKRREIAKRYNNELSDIDQIQIPLLGNNEIKPVFHVYQILTDKREELSEFLNKKGISTNIHYPTPIHLQPAYKFLGYKKGDFPISEEFSRKTLSLPMFPEIRDEEVCYICKAVKEFFSAF